MRRSAAVNRATVCRHSRREFYKYIYAIQGQRGDAPHIRFMNVEQMRDAYDTIKDNDYGRARANMQLAFISISFGYVLALNISRPFYARFINHNIFRLCDIA